MNVFAKMDGVGLHAKVFWCEFFINCTACVTDAACSEKMANITGLVNATYINGTLVNGTWHCDQEMYPYEQKIYTCNLTCIYN